MGEISGGGGKIMKAGRAHRKSTGSRQETVLRLDLHKEGAHPLFVHMGSRRSIAPDETARKLEQLFASLCKDAPWWDDDCTRAAEFLLRRAGLS